ncbi:transcription-associated protein [Schizosaccharomyces japonicus yFS275]|uniref:Transcription-associated protein n=1 Tax=Schizosaccharomyces japonicus (strain yFS275 / FY16936) TaxID=402676 RepID=B6K7A4_SCHJY|nr:transcription-associated protein [Schizosaccharomyces japonicus yFS275]EEB09408.1 transcription-associated protein [Schizosaccharomyces japonicus yFS275]
MEPLRSEAWRSRLCDAGLASKQKTNVAIELCDALNNLLASETKKEIVSTLAPVVLDLLEKEQPVFSSIAATHRLRLTLMEILRKFITFEGFSDHALRTFLLALRVVREDNEEMAVIALKLLILLFRTFGPLLQPHVREFVKLVVELYKAMPTVVAEMFPSRPPPSPNVLNIMSISNTDFATEPTAPKQLQRGNTSFKALLECPLIVVFLLQTYKELAQALLPLLAPLAIQFISLQALPQAEAHRLAESQNETFVGVVPSLRRNHHYNDFISAQVKTYSFLAYLLRGYGNALQQYKQSLPLYTLHLFIDCPPELAHARKELLIATRHVLSTDIRNDFLPYIDDLLNPKILTGTGLTAKHTLRPLAYSMLADMLHHVRHSLSLSQVYKAVCEFSNVLRDPTFTAGVQAMAIKLLLNLIERLLSFNEKSSARVILLVIIEAFVEKMELLNAEMKSIREELRVQEANRPEENDGTNNDGSDGNGVRTDSADLAKKSDLFTNQAEATNINVVINPLGDMHEKGPDKVKDPLFLFKHLILGLKSIFFGLRNCNVPCPPNSSISAQAWSTTIHFTSSSEISLLHRLLIQGCKGFYIYTVDEKDGSLHSLPLSAQSSSDFNDQRLAARIAEVKEVLEVFATIFVYLDPSTYIELLETEFPSLLECITKNLALIHLIQFWIVNETTSALCTDVLLSFLLTKLETVGSRNVETVSVLLRLFRLSFMSVNIFPEKNEAVLRPYVSQILYKCFELCGKAEQPINYFYLLRAFFRSIGGGKFDSLYKEVVPVLPLMLESFNKLLYSSRKQSEKELFAELCLTLPVRLSVLLPYISYLMRPLVIALRGPPEISNQGLRTFELCLDNLTQEFFDPLLEPVAKEVFEALWDHLSISSSQNQQQVAIRILGKMGGRNRQLPLGTSDFKNGPVKSDILTLSMSFFDDDKEFTFEHYRFINVASSILHSKSSSELDLDDAFRFTCASLKLLFSSQLPQENVLGLMGHFSKVISGVPIETFFKNRGVYGNFGDIHTEKKSIQTETVLCLFETLIYSSQIEKYKTEATELLSSVLEWLSIVDIANCVDSLQAPNKYANLVSEDTNVRLTFETFIRAAFRCLSSDLETVRTTSLQFINYYFNTAKQLLGSAELVPHLPSFHSTLLLACKNCYESQWYMKSAGFSGINCLTNSEVAGEKWLRFAFTDICKALLFIIKDTASDFSILKIDEVQASILLLLTKTCTFPDTYSTEEKCKLLLDLLSPFYFELPHPNGNVRSTVQNVLETASRTNNISVKDLLSPVKDRILAPIFGKPLRALPFALQIGHIEAITYCLSLKPAFLDYSDEFVRLLREAIALADAEDEAFLSIIKSSQVKSSNALNELRVTCLKLLLTALRTLRFEQPHQLQTRNKITSIFFKSLYNPAEDIFVIANSGLKEILSQNQKLPKEILQSGLRPILVNLSDHQRLSVNGLEGLSRLLRLLTNYFKVEIGKKLLLHLQALSGLQVLQTASLKVLEKNDAVSVISALVRVFEFLPPLAVRFLSELTSSVLRIENGLRRLKLLAVGSNYVSKLVEIAIQTPSLENLAPLFAVQILACVLPRCSEVKAVEALSAKLIISARSIHEFVTSFPDVLYLEVKNALKAVAELLLNLLSRLERKLEFALEVLKFDPDVLTEIVPSYVAELKNVLVNTATLNDAKTTFIVCCELMDDRALTLSLKTFLLDQIMFPLLLGEFGSQLIDKDTAIALHNHLWKISLKDTTEGTVFTDDIRYHTLRLTTYLCREYPKVFGEYRKSIIMSAWNYFKLEDPLVKHMAYAAASCFIAVYDTPAKIVTPVYVALLKDSQYEYKNITEFSLNCLAPVLPVRMNTMSDMTLPLWAKLPKLVISEDAHGLHQLMNIFKFICTNSKLFYPYHKNYFLVMINALQKLASVPTSNDESITLALNMIRTLEQWTALYEEEKKPVTECPLSDNAKAYVLMFLNKFIAVRQDPLENSLYAKEAMELLNKLLSHECWKSIKFNYDFFEKILVEMDNTDKNVNTIANTLNVLVAYLQQLPSDWIHDELSRLSQLLDKSIRSVNKTIFKALRKVLVPILKNVPVKTENDDDLLENRGFRSVLLAVAQDNLAAMTNLDAIIYILETFAEDHVETLDFLVTGLSKSFQKVVKDHLMLISQAASGSADGSTKYAEALEQNSSLLIRMIDVIKLRMAHLGDQRRWFLDVLIQLIDKSTSFELCSHILKLTREWVLVQRDTFPTIKEKTVLLLKMQLFEGRFSNKLVKDASDLLCEIYTNPTFYQTELTARLKQAFLFTTESKDSVIRQKFMAILDKSMSKSIYSRLRFIFESKCWDVIPAAYWIKQANYLLLGCINFDKVIAPTLQCLRFTSPQDICSRFSHILASISSDNQDEFKTSLSKRLKLFFESSNQVRAADICSCIANMQFIKKDEAHILWCKLFPSAWSMLKLRDHSDLTKSVIYLLTREFHLQQVNKRPNVIKTLISSFNYSRPMLELPPHLVKYLGKLYGIYYESIVFLEDQLQENGDVDQSAIVQESRANALAEMYASLEECDMFYGHWRNRSKYLETVVAMSYEQLGMWGRAQQLFEQAQMKARSEANPFTESEYNVWEDHWVLCTQKLQQWDVLTELAKHEGSSELLLECAWRISDWSNNRYSLEVAIKNLSAVPTPRKLTFQSLITLQKSISQPTAIVDFQKALNEAVQLSLIKWQQLPEKVNQSHLSLLNLFQQFVELQESSTIYSHLSSVNAQNITAHVSPIKSILQAWQERLPNLWENITIWRDLVSWRQITFSMINRVYLPLIPTLQKSNPSNSTSFLFRGYHETAWMINRFARVARKQGLFSVCLNLLTKIYTLPNIEIQEAFFKLREQVLCYLENSKELEVGLEVITNTNVMYFSAPQKSEFFTLKGVFLEKLKRFDEANQTYAAAVQIDLHLPRAWAEWGRYNDKLFQQDAGNLNAACNAMSCYLQAAGLFDNAKARKLISRILWMLSLDNNEGVISKSFESFKGELVTWHWITFIPQLLTSLSHSEHRCARQILARIAKTYPQALYYQLRTTREDYAIIKKRTRAAIEKSSHPEESSFNMQSSPLMFTANHSSNESHTDTMDEMRQMASAPRQPWEHVEDIMSILKTAYPLLALTMETLINQIQTRFKCKSEEDSLRLIVALLQDALQYSVRLGALNTESKVPASVESNLSVFADNVLPEYCREQFKNDFLTSNLNFKSYLEHLRIWRSRFERLLKRSPRRLYLEQISSYLSEFHYQKFDDVEIPGQYLQHRNNNTNFVRIERFLLEVDVVIRYSVCHKRITIRGSDGSLHPFAIQYPSARHSRREERIMQLLRIFNDAMDTDCQTRKRNLKFFVPGAIPLSAHIRLLTDDPTFVTLHEIFQTYCHAQGIDESAPTTKFAISLSDCLRSINVQGASSFTDEEKMQKKKFVFEKRIELYKDIQANMVRRTVVLDFFRETIEDYAHFWLFRKNFTYQYACFAFASHVLSINNRFPTKLYFTKNAGFAWTTEMLPAMASNSPVFHNNEIVPFRLTPNIQEFIGKTGMVGLFGPSIMIIARALMQPGYDLDMWLSIFIRDELIWWFTQQRQPPSSNGLLREKVISNTDLIVRRVSSIGQPAFGNLPANQTILDYISQAVNPKALAQMDVLWAPWL